MCVVRLHLDRCIYATDKLEDCRLTDTYKYCSPTRGSFLSGRLPYKLDATRCNIIPWTLLDGLDLKYELIPQKLKKAGCAQPHHRLPPPQS